MSRDLRVRDLILGTMKSAKSAQLIMKGHLLDMQGKKVLTFTPEKNIRDGAFVTSRALPHLKRPAIVVPTDDSGVLMSMKVWTEKPDVILVDELQFFTEEQVEHLAEISITHDVDIYTYGLLMSYNGRMFESIRRAIECGFNIKTLDMSCDHCNNDATHHLLYMDGVLQIDGEAVSVEDFKNKKQKYESVCFSCYTRAIDVAEMERAEKERAESVKSTVEELEKSDDLFR
jgi:thymidine kinase